MAMNWLQNIKTGISDSAFMIFSCRGRQEMQSLGKDLDRLQKIQDIFLLGSAAQARCKMLQ